MADTILTKAQVEDIFRVLTLQLLGVDPATDKKRVRMTWPSNGQPAWKIGEDVTFLLVNFDDDPIARQLELSYDAKDANTAAEAQTYTRVIRVDWICYGPNSYEDADTIRSGLFRPSTGLQLKPDNLALITDVPQSVRTPELYNGQWWERTSFFARFNELVIRRADVPYLQSADVQTVKG